MTPLPACATRQTDFRGWSACHLENGFVRLVAVPAIGGRVMAYDLGPYGYFFVDPTLAGKLFTPEEHQGDGSLAAWKNYGGDKTWPAPQGWDDDSQWHGPPDPVLDSGQYMVNEMGSDPDSAVVRMTSLPDLRTGVQITRQFRLFRGSSRVVLTITFKNISDHPIRWSLWDVSQLRAERALPGGALAHEPACTVTVPVNPDSVFPKGYSVLFGAEDNPQWQVEDGLFVAPYQWQIGKVALDSAAGWVAFSNTAAGYAFTARYAYEPGGEYPDGGATVEVWTVGAGEVGNLNYEDSDIYLMEAEVLSPMRTIPPGESTQFTITWGACRGLDRLVQVNEGGGLWQPLTVTAQALGFVRLCAAGGVFDAGTLQLRWLGADGSVISSQPLGQVDPLSVVSIDHVLKNPENAVQAELWVVASQDGSERLWAAAALE